MKSLNKLSSKIIKLFNKQRILNYQKIREY